MWKTNFVARIGCSRLWQWHWHWKYMQKNHNKRVLLFQKVNIIKVNIFMNTDFEIFCSVLCWNSCHYFKFLWSLWRFTNSIYKNCSPLVSNLDVSIGDTEPGLYSTIYIEYQKCLSFPLSEQNYFCKFDMRHPVFSKIYICTQKSGKNHGGMLYMQQYVFWVMFH